MLRGSSNIFDLTPNVYGNNSPSIDDTILADNVYSFDGYSILWSNNDNSFYVPADGDGIVLGETPYHNYNYYYFDRLGDQYVPVNRNQYIDALHVTTHEVRVNFLFADNIVKINDVVGSSLFSLLQSYRATVIGSSVDDVVLLSGTFGVTLHGDGGNDTLGGGDGTDTIYGGTGNDTFIGSYGNDSLNGYAGQDVFDFRDLHLTGPSVNMVQSLNGGLNDTDAPDILKLPGSANDYSVNTIFAGVTGESSFVSFSTKTSTTLTLQAVGVEIVEFTNPVNNTINLGGGGLTLHLAKLASEVYGSISGLHTREAIGYEPNAGSSLFDPSIYALGQNWYAMSALDFGIAPADMGLGEIRYTFGTGHYMAYRLDDLFPGDDAQLHAIVMLGVLDGKTTLSVTFRGTDQLADFVDFTDFAKHYAKFEPLAIGLKAWLSLNHVDQILAAGHSLGGAMVQYFLRDFEGLAANLKGYTWGSPGAEISPVSSPVVNFIHTDDLIPKLGDLTSIAGKSAITLALSSAFGLSGTVLGAFLSYAFETKTRSGSEVLINSPVSDLPYSVAEHAMADSYASYLDDTRALEIYANDAGAGSFFYFTALAASLRSGNPYAGPDIELSIGRNDSYETIAATYGDRYVLAGQGFDVIALRAWSGLGLLDTRTTKHVDGGTGVDGVVIDDYSGFYTKGTTGTAITITSFNGSLDAYLYRVEWIAFKDGFDFLGAVANVQRPGVSAGPAQASGLTAFRIDPLLDYADAGDGDMEVHGSASGDRIQLGRGDKIVMSGDGDDFILVKSTFASGPLTDTIIINGGLGSDIMIGGAGNETYYVDNSGDQVSEEANRGVDKIVALVDYTLPEHVEQLYLSGSSIAGIGNAGDNQLFGNDADNLLTGMAGSDAIDGGAGFNIANYGIEGLGGATDGVTVNLLTISGPAFVLDAFGTYDALTNIQGIIGTGYSDSLWGTNATNKFVAGGGDDILVAWGGDDDLAGGEGDDTIFGWTGNDTLSGDAGNDYLWSGDGSDHANGGDGDDVVVGDLSGSAEVGDDHLTGGLGGDTLLGGAGNDTLIGATEAEGLEDADDANWMIGGSGNDTYYGAGGDDIIWEQLDSSENGTDTVFAGAGNDLILVGRDADIINAGSGNDVIYGGEGADYILTGAGNDTLWFTGIGDIGDTISDFTSGQDRMVISSLLGGARSIADAFAGNYLSLAQYNEHTLLWYDADGSAGAVGAVLVANLLNIDVSGFNVGVDFV